MPYKNNRNGRDDKSFKTDRSSSFDKNERQSGDKRGSFKRFSKDSGSQENEKFRGNRSYRDSESRPRNERPPYKDSESRPRSERPPYRDADSRPRQERPAFRKRDSDNDFRERRSNGESGFKSGSYNRNDRKGGFKKDFSSDKPYGAGRGKSDYGDDKRSRPGSGDERRGSGFNNNFRGKRSERPTERKWTHEEQLEPTTRLRSRKPAEPKDDGLIRLNRYIANAGICSRRKADELIEAGVVSVNGVVISELGHKVNPQTDEIRYNGSVLKREKMVYVLLNKPKDYITTTDDPQERRTVMQLVDKASKERIYPVGRLDRNTTGLLLMTNDGDLAEKLSHPRNNITKIYQVELSKGLTQGDLNKIEFGLELEDGFVKPDAVSFVQGGSKKEIGIQIHSGKNRIVRRIFEHLGYEVVKLDRVVYANLTKKDLPRGRWRYLDEKEIIQLKHFIK